MVASTHPNGPSWDQLFETAAAHAGYFTTQQAATAGYSSQLLRKHMLAGRVTRAQRGIYRLVHFPASDHEAYMTAWLWSERVGVCSHQTALVLHQLSDVLPSQLHLTLPSTWQTRRLRIPLDLRLHYADLMSHERLWFDTMPVTSPARTLNDCARSGISPEVLRMAAHQALQRKLVKRSDLPTVLGLLKSFGGL